MDGLQKLFLNMGPTAFFVKKFINACMAFLRGAGAGTCARRYKLRSIYFVPIPPAAGGVFEPKR